MAGRSGTGPAEASDTSAKFQPVMPLRSSNYPKYRRSGPAQATLTYADGPSRVRTIGYSPGQTTILITGGTRGIGRLLAEGLAAAGAFVEVVARDKDELA